MRYIYTMLFCIITQIVQAQNSEVSGTLIDASTKQVVKEASITISKLKTTTSSDANGTFTLHNVPFGNYEMIVSTDGISEEKIAFAVNNATTNLGTIEVKHTTDNIHLTTDAQQANEQSGADDEGGAANATVVQNVSSALNSSRDPFLNAATFGWGQYFYRLRGYEGDNSLMYLNGIPMNDLEEGGVQYNAWSGLNDVFRGRSQTMGLALNEYNIGDLGMNTSLDATASNQRKQTRLNFAQTNRAYRSRMMLTHSSGLKKNGWAYSFSFSRRWANEGAVKGTFYDAYGYYAAVEKRWNHSRNGINFMVVGAPLQRGKVAPSFKESFDITGTHLYNPNWGYQNGKVRNSKVLHANTPLLIGTYDAQLTTKTNMTTAVGYLSGETYTTGLDRRANAYDPRPDYYKNMPFYQETDRDKLAQFSFLQNNLDNEFQINWAEIYQANYFAKANNLPNPYVLGADVEKTKRWNVGINLQSNVNDKLIVYNGLTFQNQINHNFKRVEDLLGGTYFENTNQYADRDFPGNTQASQYNLNDANVEAKIGDAYNYNYKTHFKNASWFTQAALTLLKFDIFAGAEVSFTNFYREGLYRSGIHTSNSYGNSYTQQFLNYKTKAGITYKINGRNYININGAFGTRAPKFDNIFIAPRVNNNIVPIAANEQYQSIEIGYTFRSPFVKIKINAYDTDVKNASDIKRFFGYFNNAFINQVLVNINKRYTGLELGAEIKLSPAFTLNAAVSLGQAFYTNSPNYREFKDNDTAVVSLAGYDNVAYVKNYLLNAGPQTATQLSLNYRSKNFWYSTVSVNYLDRAYKDFMWSKRTQDGIGIVPANSELYHEIVDQEKLPYYYTVDLNMGKSFKVNKYIKKANNSMLMYFNLGITNILNNKNIILYGFENGLKNQSTYLPIENSVQSKYSYAQGLQYFLNVSLKF